MSRYSKDSGGGDFAQVPSGSHVARCIRLTDLGTQHGEYQGEPTVRNQVLVTWELPAETVEFQGETKPMLISKFYTNSLSEKANLRKDLESWRSRQFTGEELLKFDLMKVLGAPCMLSVTHNDKAKASVVGVSALPKGMDCPPQVHKSEAFWLDEFDQTKFEAISEGIKKIIMQSDEYQKMVNPAAHRTGEPAPRTNDFDSDIPF